MNYNSPNNGLLSCGLYTITREVKNNNNIISRQVESSSQGAISAPFTSRIENSRGTCLSARKLNYQIYCLLMRAHIVHRSNKKSELHLHNFSSSKRTVISHGIIYVRRKSLPVIPDIEFWDGGVLMT